MTTVGKLLAGLLCYVLLFAAEQSLLVTGAFALASDCTKYSSARGSGTACTVGSPCTLDQANSTAVPGDRICFMGAGGKFVRSNGFAPKSGNATGSTWPPSLSNPHAWCPNCVVYEAYGDSPAWITNNQNYNASSFNFLVHGDFTFRGASVTCNTNKPDSFSSNSAQYIIIDGLNFDGAGPNTLNGANTGIIFYPAHHIMVIDNYVRNTAGAGIGFINADYVFVAGNTVWHNGEGNRVRSSATSGISLNGVAYYDRYTGFHNYVLNNMISGDLDDQSNTDGNGYISDLSCSRVYDINQANTPPELIANNVIFMNGGNCVMLFTVTNNYLVNNTCYKNDLNTNLGASHIGEMGDNTSHDNYFINNLVYTWEWHSSTAYFKNGRGEKSAWTHNLWYGTGPNFNLPGRVYANRNPLFVGSPAVQPYPKTNEWQNAPDPKNVGDAFRLQANSPALGAGVNPTTLPGLDPNIVTDMRRFIYSDISGHPRPVGGPFDVGAYQH